MNAPKFDGTITLGHLISSVVFLVPVVGFAFVASERLDRLEDAVGNVNDVLIQIAVQKVTIGSLERRMERIEVGNRQR